MRCTAPCTAPRTSTPIAHRSPAPRFTRRRPPASTRASTPSRRAHPGSALGPATIKRRMERMYNPAPSSARRLLHVNSLSPRRRAGLLHHASSTPNAEAVKRPNRRETRKDTASLRSAMRARRLHCCCLLRLYRASLRTGVWTGDPDMRQNKVSPERPLDEGRQPCVGNEGYLEH
ncbi:uncharacterized protein SCHCODRAFT_02302900 [Schizophyllum commune H4-8]|uniref:uncharacterized protein n=1 Tax=Schizophyllum commune (strain H4-8 / FGSC 9210) TaxID=578458 RepID=UPI00215EA227|nr:uncharacterized protein SCHCODRAFT_02302900 [Schizophyllum commune H4-8]KAI5892849.1 hypothetical protein SCHCODRAFT_02302900 [Schizophyllum commune H4-8]